MTRASYAQYGDQRLPTRFWEKVLPSPETDCWDWTAYVTKNGYGRFKYRYRHYQAYRFAWERLVGPIPDDHEIDHLCQNKLCVNPRHLEPVSHQENIQRMFDRRDTCLHGHDWYQSRARVNRSNGKSHFVCGACKRERRRKNVGDG